VQLSIAIMLAWWSGARIPCRSMYLKNSRTLLKLIHLSFSGSKTDNLSGSVIPGVPLLTRVFTHLFHFKKCSNLPIRAGIEGLCHANSRI
jgi:hypothetical protein